MKVEKRPVIVGIIGGVASGKSTVAERWERRGALRLNADAIGHALLNEDRSIRKRVIESLGETIVDASGQVDRKRIASLVFGDDAPSKARLEALESILHPGIRRAVEQRLDAARMDPELPMVLLDAPLLLEADWAGLCDEIVFVETPLDLRQQLAARRGWESSELAKRESTQMALHQKRAAATRVIENRSGLDALWARCDRLWDEILGRTH